MLKLNDPNFSVLRLKNRHWLPAIQRIRFYFPACHLLVWEPYFSLLNCLSSVCLGRSYYLFNLKSLLALFPKARTPFICFSIFHDILKIWLLRTSSSHDLWSEYEFPMKILTTRCFKIVSSLTSATCLALLEYCCAMTSAQTASLETFLGSWGAVTPHCAFWSRTTQYVFKWTKGQNSDLKVTCADDTLPGTNQYGHEETNTDGPYRSSNRATKGLGKV